jgi:hypothetical protein
MSVRMLLVGTAPDLTMVIEHEVRLQAMTDMIHLAACMVSLVSSEAPF